MTCIHVSSMEIILLMNIPQKLKCSFEKLTKLIHFTYLQNYMLLFILICVVC